MMRRKFLHRVEGDGATSYDDRGLCGTNCIMMEVGGATSSMMKERGATKSNSRNCIK